MSRVIRVLSPPSRGAYKVRAKGREKEIEDRRRRRRGERKGEEGEGGRGAPRRDTRERTTEGMEYDIMQEWKKRTTKKGTAANRARAMMGAKGRDLKPHGHCHRTRSYKLSRVPRCWDQVDSSLFHARFRHKRVTCERGAGIYTPRYIHSLSSCRRSMGTGAFLHAIYSRCVYDLGNRTGTSIIFHRFVRARARPYRHFKSRADF